MTSLNTMNRSSMRGIFLSVVLLFSITLISIPENVYGEVNANSIGLEETTIIEFTNELNEEINTFRIWLGADFNFKSFKTEKGWVGEKTPQGVIIFTTSEPIKKGESVKFGVKTDNKNPRINWKAIDTKSVQQGMGKVLPKELPKVVENTEIKPTQTGAGVLSDSIFRIIPEKPNVGSSIRVTGDNFGASQEFDFYIDNSKIGSFVTDENGHFMTTMKIPENQGAERVDFKVKDSDGEEKKISLRIGQIENRIPEADNIKLTIKGIPNVIHRGDFLEILGTGKPNGAVTAEITNPEGEIINSRTAEVDSKGNWELAEPIIIPLDTPFGKYSATITDGRENILKSWVVETDKKIIIAPHNLKFEPGEVMKFNGTALPNKPIELILEDPLGKELFSDIIQLDESGFVEFEHTTEQSSAKGTYTLIATQEKDTEFIFAGLGQLPTIPVNLEFDELNYSAGDTAIISLTGKASEIVSLLIIDPSDKPKGDSISITLAGDGTAEYELDLSGYASGVYSAVVSKGSAQSSEVFTVGLQTGSGDIQINTTKLDYAPGDSILILGDTAKNVLLTITLSDPDGNIIKEKDTFSDKNGKISESSFRIPSDAEGGMWSINAKSGANFDTIEVEVIATATEGIQISVEEGEEIPGYGQTLQIIVIGVSQTVDIDIISEDGEVIESLAFQASGEGEINQPWIIPKDTEPGTYTIKVSDAFTSGETTFEITG
ncbi:MG2 domain protein [Marine Group I thaumarchaeote SCGC AAA799-E16]|uniref:MG2 domain protein n=6 Tax=Marine Group I TaxID=905826 RepID=A0A081RNH6_9ARCH|nr:MG2 domain protein [Marine Group I thaumarchaeote SCGC AAA799-N04]KER06317.1 MG2 domain protein [Marine Group I thaumarchaeote SCGC AAA799-E16]KFM15457.1 MG2 domain protein [Marine Group I thaumarchaeote SCGC AAA799-D11]KFM16699.1 MG2 domain protein [Marine Group I thaumarchaeote SCGC RSA3]